MRAAEITMCAVMPGNERAELHVHVWGEHDPTFLFIHGLGEGSFVWHHIVSSLSHFGSVMAVDLRGHGDSPRDATYAYETHTHVADVSVVLLRLGARPVIVVGHSLGAEIAIHLWARHHSGIRGLVLIDGGPELNEDALAFSREQFAMQPWTYQTTDEYAFQLQERFPLSAPELLRSLAPYALRSEPQGGYQLKCDKALTRHRRSSRQSLWPLFRSIACPILAIRGAGSAILPRSMAIRMTRENPHCVLQTVALAGHAVMLDNPSGFIAALGAYTSVLNATNTS